MLRNVRQSASRALGTAERWFWLMNQNRPVHFLLAASFHGTQPEELWREAIHLASARHPMLRVVIVREGDELVFVESSPRVSFRCAKREDDTHWKRTSEEQMNTPLAPEGDELLRVTLLHDDKMSDLILCLHHSIADGMSTLHLIHEILQSFSGVKLTSYQLPKSMDRLIEEHIRTPTVLPPSSSSQNWPTRYRDQSRKAAVEVQTLSVNQTRRLRWATRERGTTVGQAISAAFTLAGQQLSEAWQELPVRIFLPVDLRKRLRLSDELMYAVGISVIALNSNKSDKGFWQLAVEAKEQLAPKLQSASIAETHMTIASLYQGLNNAEEYATLSERIFGFDLLQTNLGVWNFTTSWGRLSLHRIAGPMVSVGFEGEQTVGLTTVNGELTLTHLSFEPIPGFLSRAIEILLTAIEGTLVEDNANLL
jgi:NRPS condensation-like uncharacterized protein